MRSLSVQKVHVFSYTTNKSRNFSETALLIKPAKCRCYRIHVCHMFVPEFELCPIYRRRSLIKVMVSAGFYRASICEGGLGSRNSVRPSVCLSVCLTHACIVTKLNDALQIVLYHTKAQSLCYSDTKSGWWATPPSL